MNNKNKLGIALISDFYYPNQGGVEIHIHELARLLSDKYRIIVITHQRDNYVGRMEIGGITIYYLEIAYIKSLSMSYPTFILNFMRIKSITERENIQIFHCHQSCSPLSLECLFFAKILKVKSILTEHSLVGFSNISDIHYNIIFQILLPPCEKIIAVSRTTRNNIILRANLNPQQVTVIPNGVKKPSIKHKIKS